MALPKLNVRETKDDGRLSSIPGRVLLFITVAMCLFCYTQFLKSNLEAQGRKLQNPQSASFADYFSHAIDSEGANFGYSIDSYYDANTKTSANIVAGKGLCWVGIGTDKLGQKISGMAIPFSLKGYVGANDLLSVQINSQVGLITSKDFAYMIRYDRQQSDGSIIFRAYRYWRYVNLAILTHFSLGNNIFVNLGKLTGAQQTPFFSIVPFNTVGNSGYKYFRTDSVDDSIGVAENDRFIAIGMPNKDSIAFFKSYPKWNQKITVDNLKTKPYVLDIGPLRKVEEQHVEFANEGHLIAIGDPFTGDGSVAIFLASIHPESSDISDNIIKQLCRFEGSSLGGNGAKNGFGEALHVTKRSVYISAKGIGSIFVVHVQRNKCTLPKLLFQGIPSFTRFPGQYLAFSKQTNRLLVGVANALNGKNLPEGRIYYYTACEELNIENRVDGLKYVRIQDGDESSTEWKCFAQVTTTKPSSKYFRTSSAPPSLAITTRIVSTTAKPSFATLSPTTGTTKTAAAASTTPTPLLKTTTIAATATTTTTTKSATQSTMGTTTTLRPTSSSSESTTGALTSSMIPQNEFTSTTIASTTPTPLLKTTTIAATAITATTTKSATQSTMAATATPTPGLTTTKQLTSVTTHSTMFTTTTDALTSSTKPNDEAIGASSASTTPFADKNPKKSTFSPKLVTTPLITTSTVIRKDPIHYASTPMTTKMSKSMEHVVTTTRLKSGRPQIIDSIDLSEVFVNLKVEQLLNLNGAAITFVQSLKLELKAALANSLNVSKSKVSIISIKEKITSYSHVDGDLNHRRLFPSSSVVEISYGVIVLNEKEAKYLESLMVSQSYVNVLTDKIRSTTNMQDLVIEFSEPVMVEENSGSSDCENSLSEFAFACSDFDYGRVEIGSIIGLENLTANITVVTESARPVKKILNEDVDHNQNMLVEADEKRVGSLSILIEILLLFGGIVILGFMFEKSCGPEIRKRLRRKMDFVEVYGSVVPSNTPRMQYLGTSESNRDIEMINLSLEMDIITSEIEDVSQDEDSEDPSSDDEDERALLNNLENIHAVGPSNMNQIEGISHPEVLRSENEIDGSDYSDCTDVIDENENEDGVDESEAGLNDGLTMVSDFLLELKGE